MKRSLLAALVAAVLGIATVALVEAHPASAAGHAHMLGAKALHPQDYARAKAAANAQAAQTKGGGGGGTKGGGGGGGKPSPSPSPSPGTVSWDGQYENDLTPGDPTGAVGPTRYVELVNVKFGIYGRTGSLIAAGSLNALTGASSGSSLSDPQILWDPLTQRFYYLVLNVSTNALMYGFSTSSSPSSTSDFCKYVFGNWNPNLPDYPKIGSTSDFILAGVNVFDSSGTTYLGSDVGWATKPHVNGVPTSATLTGCTGFDALHAGDLSHLKNADGSDTATPVPAIQTDPSATGWVVGTDDATLPGSTNNYISVFSVTNNGGTPAIALSKTVAVPTFGVPASASQAGTSATIDTLDGRLEKAVAGVDPSNGGVTGIWTAHAVFGGAGSEERWYEIDPDPSSGGLLRSGKASDPGKFIWNGAVSPDRAVPASLVGSFGGDMVMGFNVSSTASYPAIAMGSVRAGGTQSPATIVKSSSAGYVDFSCSPCRWGDYSSGTPDPAAPASAATGVVWLSGEYNTSGGGVFSAPWRSWNWAVSP